MSRPEIARQSNDHIADQAIRHKFVSRVPMLCECADPACTTIVLISLDAYHDLRQDPSLYLTAPEHAVPNSSIHHSGAKYWLQRRHH